MSGDDSEFRQPKQVLPDVDEGAELFGHSILSLLQLFTPAFSILFYAVNFAPDGLGGPLFAVGLVVAFGTLVIIFAAPSGEPPAKYAKTLYRHYTQQGIKVHE